MLMVVGYMCYVFKEGKVLKKCLQCEMFDLLVFDWNVFDMFGEEVFKWVCVNQIEYSLLIIFMMSCDDEVGIMQIFNVGVDDYVVKFVLGLILCVCIGLLLCCVYLVNVEVIVCEFDQFCFDVNLKQVYVGDKVVSFM